MKTVIEMAREAGFEIEQWGYSTERVAASHTTNSKNNITPELERFAEIVIAEFKEANK